MLGRDSQIIQGQVRAQCAYNPTPGRLKQHCHKFKANLSYVRRLCLKQINRIKQKPNQTKSSNNKEQHLGLIGINLLMDLDTFMGLSYLQRLKK